MIAAAGLLAEQQRRAGDQPRCETSDLRQSEPEHQPAQALQALERQFEPDREHQCDDAELREPVDRLDVGQRTPLSHGARAGEPAEAIGAEHDARQHVAEHRADAKAHEQRRHDAGRDQEQQRLAIDRDIALRLHARFPDDCRFVGELTRNPRTARRAHDGFAPARLVLKDAHRSGDAHGRQRPPRRRRRDMKLAPVIPVLTVRDVADGVAQARALVAGGLPAIEVTLRTPAALDAIAEIARAVPGAHVGAGTIVEPRRSAKPSPRARPFWSVPGASPALAAAAAEAPIPFLPGVATPSEAMTLRALGFRALKLFPAEAVGGARLLASLSAPLPDLVFCPTGGIDVAKAPTYLGFAQCAVRRRLVDAAEGGAGGGRLREGRDAVARGGGVADAELKRRRAALFHEIPISRG